MAQDTVGTEATPTGARSLSPAGLRFIGRWEGFRGRLYEDPLGHCTIGFGHLVHRGPCDGSEPLAFRKGLTGAEALALLRRDAAVAVRAVKSAVRVSLAQHEFDALVSFAFNVGSTAFATSTLVKVLNQGARGAVPKELARWTNQGLPGLVRRRQAEGALFAHGRYS